MDKKIIKEKLEQGLSDYSDAQTLDKPVTKKIAGFLIKCVKTGNVFLLYRNSKPPIWAMVSGTMDDGEDPLVGIKRELFEEIFHRQENVEIKFGPPHIEQEPEKNREFYYYEAFTNEEFTPILDWENLDSGWFPKNKLPSPLYNGLAEKIAKI